MIQTPGARPLVVSYASSPPSEVPDGATSAPTGALLDTCVRQVEYAGVLAGTKHVAAARAVVDWLLSSDVQADVPNSMYVLPARDGVTIPDVFAKWTARPLSPLSVPADEITANRATWVDQWTDLVVH